MVTWHFLSTLVVSDPCRSEVSAALVDRFGGQSRLDPLLDLALILLDRLGAFQHRLDDLPRHDEAPSISARIKSPGLMITPPMVSGT